MSGSDGRRPHPVREPLPVPWNLGPLQAKAASRSGSSMRGSAAADTTSSPRSLRRRAPGGRRRTLAGVLRTAVVLSAALTLVCQPGTGVAGPGPSVGDPITEQHAHIAGDPGTNEVDLALRTRRRGDDAGTADPGAGRGGYSFEPVSPQARDGAPPDPCAQLGGQLVNVVPQSTAPAAAPATPIRTACLTRELVAITNGTAGISADAAAELLRSVVLPGGTIRAVPGATGLAGLDTRFRLDGAVQPPVDLVLGQAVLHAEFTATGQRWSFGSGGSLNVAGSGGSGDRSGDSAGRAVSHTFQRGGQYRVEVQTIWSARGFLGTTPIVGVDGLVSTADLTYPVHEVYGVLTR